MASTKLEISLYWDFCVALAIRTKYLPAKRTQVTPKLQALTTSSGSYTRAHIRIHTLFIKSLCGGSWATFLRVTSSTTEPPRFLKWILSNFQLFAECDRPGPLNLAIISPQPQTEQAQWRNIKTPAAKFNSPG